MVSYKNTPDFIVYNIISHPKLLIYLCPPHKLQAVFHPGKVHNFYDKLIKTGFIIKLIFFFVTTSCDM